MVTEPGMPGWGERQSSAPLEGHTFQGVCLRDSVQRRVLKAQFNELMSYWRKTDEEAPINKSASWRAAGGENEQEERD